MTLVALIVAVAATLLVVLVAWRARRRRAARRDRRLAALEATARRIDTAVGSLRELDLHDRDEPAPTIPRDGPPPPVADDLPGRAALVEALTTCVAEARSEGSRVAAAFVRSGADDATTLARHVRTVVDAPVYAVGTRAVAFVLPGLGRAEALGLLARIEAACHTSGRAVELEQGEDGVDLVARLLETGGSVPAGE